MGWIEIPQGPLIVATETGPSTEVADPFPKMVVILLTILIENCWFVVFFGEKKIRKLTIEI